VSTRRKKKWKVSTNLFKNIPVGAIVTGSVGAFVAPVSKPKELQQSEQKKKEKVISLNEKSEEHTCRCNCS